MKKKFYLITIILILIVTAIIMVSCTNDELKPDLPAPTKMCSVLDFQSLQKVFPRKLILPNEFTNENISVNNSELMTYPFDVKHEIALQNKVDTLDGGKWEKKFTDYTIFVHFSIEEYWKTDDEFMHNYNEGELYGYQIYESKDKRQVFILDKQNKMYYSISVSSIIEFTHEQYGKAVYDYIDLMCRI